jgi:hypothetical protein
MDKDQQLLKPVFEPFSLPTASPWQQPPFSSNSLQVLLLDDMARHARISPPNTASVQSSWDIEGIGASPRKVSLSTERPPTSSSVGCMSSNKPLPNLPLDRTFAIDKPLSCNNSWSSGKNSLPLLTSDLDSGESEASGSQPSTPPYSSLSVTTTSTVVSSTVPFKAAKTSGEEHRRKHGSQVQLDIAPELRVEREQFHYVDAQSFHKFAREDVPFMQAYSAAAIER